MSRRRAVFLDRDGTLIEDVGYLNRADQLRVLPGVPAALRDLRAAGFLLIVVTNQSAVARGWLTEPKLCAINQRLNAMLRAEGAGLDAFYCCPHLPDGTVRRYTHECECRKPRPGLLLKAADEWGIDLERSYAVGDSERDVVAGNRTGCHTILIAEGSTGLPDSAADECAADLAEAAHLILRREGREFD
ncbi:MAG: HAD family hydrolase [Candidatus Brocadiia bacterium]